jgi:hypothetical protein
MTVEEAVLARVTALAGVQALVGSRVYLEMLPQSPVYPCVRVTEIDDPGSYQMRGPDGMGRARVQVDAFAREGNAYDAAATLVEAIEGDGAGRNATGLSGWIGEVGSPPFFVLACQRIDRRRQFDPDEIRVLMMSLDYRVTYRTT